MLKDSVMKGSTTFKVTVLNNDAVFVSLTQKWEQVTIYSDSFDICQMDI